MKKEINLMLGTDYRGRGGIASVINNYKKNLLLKKINSKFIATHKSNTGKLELVLIFFRALIKIFYYIIFYKVKIVHIHTASDLSFFRKMIFSLICSFFSLKVLMHIHGGNFIFFYNKSNIFIKALILIILKKTYKIIVLNVKFKKFFKNLNLNKKTLIIPNSIKINRMNNLKNNRDKKIILFLGNLTMSKGIYDLFKAIQIIIKNNKNIKFILCGPDKKKNFYKLSKKMQINQNVVFIDWASGIKKKNLFSKTKIFLLPSYIENFPISILEAMENSVPIISTNVGGIPSQVKHNYSGYLIKPGDIKNLVKYINRLYRNSKLCNLFGKKGNKILRTKFSNEIVFKKIINLYNT
jgi:polysaccharide biosynthesis protein VpsI